MIICSSDFIEIETIECDISNVWTHRNKIEMRENIKLRFT